MRRIGEQVPPAVNDAAGSTCGHDADGVNNSCSETSAVVTENKTVSEQRVTTPQGTRKKKG